jgi:hypothetical protein
VFIGLALVAGFAIYTVSLLTLIEEQAELVRKMRNEHARWSEEVAELLTGDRVEFLHLSGPSREGGWKGVLLWDRQVGRAWLQITGIAPSDTIVGYRLWIVGKGLPSDVVRFRVPREGPLSLLIQQMPTVDNSGAALIVTTDPDGSAQFGSGTMLLAGSIPSKGTKEK